MLGNGTPEILELLDERIVFRQFFFEIAVRVHVNNHGKTLCENHPDGVVEILQIFGRKFVGLPTTEHWLRIHA
jgi:hypothetical protein